MEGKSALQRSMMSVPDAAMFSKIGQDELRHSMALSFASVIYGRCHYARFVGLVLITDRRYIHMPSLSRWMYTSPGYSLQLILLTPHS